MTNEVWKTAEVADLLGTEPKVIRALKAEHAELLQEGSHWAKEKGSTSLLWTAQGVTDLARLLGKPSPLPDAELREALKTLVEPHAMHLAKQVVEQALIEQLRAILLNPTEEQYTIMARHIYETSDRLARMTVAIALRDVFSAANHDHEQLLKAG